MPFTAQKLAPPSNARHSTTATVGISQLRALRLALRGGGSGLSLGTGGGWTPGPLGQR